MKTGQEFRIFETTPPGGKYYPPVIGSQWAAEDSGTWYGSSIGVNLNCITSFGPALLHFGIDHRRHARLVGRVIITKIKQ